MASDFVGNYLKKKAYGDTVGPDMQTIPARHGTATFVPSGSTIKIVNTSGTQVIDTWAFALPNPPTENEKKQTAKEAEKAPEQSKPEPAPTPKKSPAKKGKGGMDLPSQEEAEKATAQGIADDAQKDTPAKKKGWSSYIPSVGLRSQRSDEQKSKEAQNSKTWSEYLGAGQSVGNYIPTKQSLSAFASKHNRDKSKPYVAQLADFSKTPVGAAGISALSGSGYASSLYAGYSAWSSAAAGNEPPMEFLSMPHTRAATEHLTPKVHDVLVSNLREPMLTVLEDQSPGIHDTLIAACDPQRYKGLGVENWEEHGSCAENLVMALKELNERAGLKGPKGIGADVTVNSVPAPLNLFMNIPWTDKGDLDFESPGGKPGDFIVFRAERDVVMVMSACPQDVLKINAKDPSDAHFKVEAETDDADEDIKAKLAAADEEKSTPKPQRPQPTPKTAPKKLNGTTSAPKPSPSSASTTTTSSAAPAQAKKAAPSTSKVGQTKTPIGQKKTPIGQKKTPIGQKKTPIGQKKTPMGTQKSAPSAASKPSAPSEAGDASKKSEDAPKKVEDAPKKAEDAPKKAEDAPKKADDAASGGAEKVAEEKAPVQKKKPRKLGKPAGASA